MRRSQAALAPTDWAGGAGEFVISTSWACSMVPAFCRVADQFEAAAGWGSERLVTCRNGAPDCRRAAIRPGVGGCGWRDSGAARRRLSSKCRRWAGNDLGPLADRIGLRLVSLPVILGQRGDTFGQLRTHIGRDRIADRLLVEPAHQLVLVQRTVAAQIDRVDAARQCGERLLDHPPVARAGRHLPSRNSSARITSCSAHSASTG